jgi:uncharacterized protein DUF1553/uncharacterized protein DUF1549/cytochrome c
MTLSWRMQLACFLALGGFVGTPTRAEVGREEFFEKQIRPVLVEQCYECHSAGSKKVRGHLRVDSRSALLQGGDTGPALVPGKPEQSLLYAAITHQDKELAMPSKKPKLPEPVLQDFYRWIQDGAVWPGEEAPVAAKIEGFDLEARKRRWPWIWQTPSQPVLPAVTNRDWPKVDADYFILAKLEEKGLKPAPAAEARTWLRRAYFAITGLPPSPDEIHAFLADGSPNARQRVVERLLASPHYGERWARHWMDLVRYAESRGHESDYSIANAYHYRDYLIRAFNADVPYNQFLLEHIAGDLLPQPRLDPTSGGNESVLATGWAFLGEEVHSPVDIRQDECDRNDNKIDVFTKTFLGLTVGCARCHDHKFDAISSQDYYALSGFVLSSSFRQVRFETMENNRPVAQGLERLRSDYRPKLLKAASAACRPGVNRAVDYLLAARRIWIDAQPDQRPSRIDAEAKHHSLQPERLSLWVNALEKAGKDPQDPLHQFATAAREAKLAESPSLTNQTAEKMACLAAPLPEGARVIADYSEPGLTPWKVDGFAFGSGPLRAGDICFSRGSANPVSGVMTYGAARRDPFWRKLKIAPGNEDDAGTLAATSRAGQMLCTPTFTLGCGKLHYLLRGKVRVYAAVDSHIMIAGPLHGNLVQVFDGTKSDGPAWFTQDLSAYSGHRAHLEFGPDGDQDLEVLLAVESNETPTWLPVRAYACSAAEAGSPRRWARAFQHDLTTACLRLGRDSIAGANDALTQAILANWLVQNLALFVRPGDPRLEPVVQEYCAAEARLDGQAKWQSRTAVAWFDGTGVDEHVLVRGKATRPGPLAPRSLPAAFPGAAPIRTTVSSGRYKLGQELVDSKNPLVARVIVNRVWHHLFGRGIVASVDNFGYLGERPSHPELLDALAWRFVHEDGWSIKRLIQRLVLSSTFAMSSRAGDNAAEAQDPANLLLHRMAIRRLEAEVIRDSLLSVSGRLNPTLGGPPVPVYLTEFVIGRGRPEQSGPLEGDGRRSLYTAVRRNFLPTFMLAFDTPTPFSTVGRRNVTNVPAQSLALMNDPLVHQQARLWAERLLREKPAADIQDRISWLFESAYGRLPTPVECAACSETLGDLEREEAKAEDSPEVWSDLCHALFNANDFIYLK